MNKVVLMGRLTKDPDVRYGGQGNQLAIARFSLAVDRRQKQENGQTAADFFNCTAFGKLGEFVERYLKKGVKILAIGRIQNDNYTNQRGEKVYSVQIMLDEIEFTESKNAAAKNGSAAAEQTPPASPDGFMVVADAVDDADLPFN